MDFVLEIIAELIIEGCWKGGTSKKVPLPLRILLLTVLFGVFAALTALFVLIGIQCLDRGDTALAVLILAIGALLAFIFIYLLIRIYKEIKNKKE